MDVFHITFLLFLVALSFAALWFRNLYLQSQKELKVKNEELNNHLVAKAQLETQIVGFENQLKNMESIEKRFTDQFENLSSKILKENSESFKEESTEKIDTLMKPYKDSLDDFKKQFQVSQESRIRESQDFKNEFLKLSDMNKRLSDDANNLTKALKMNPKMRGNWGETILEKLLEKSGLVKNYHYRREVSGSNDEYNLRADVIIDLPGERNLVIDSKMSLNAYYEYCSSDEENGDEHLSDHVASIRKHIDTLHRKQYDKMYEINSPDIVFMFVPIEAGLMAALHSDPELSTYAIHRNIMLVTNSTLFAMLNMVSQLWQRNKQFENAERIADLILLFLI